MKPAFRSMLVVLLACASCCVPCSAFAQAYPDKTIKIIVPFAPGGGSDFIARFIAQRLQAALGQTVMVDNRPGAGGNIGTEAGVNAPADGYTLTLIASSYTTNQAIYKAKYDPVTDITPIVQLSQGPMVVVASNAFAPNSMNEMIALAKSKPGEVTLASAGTGSITHMAGELFASMAGVKLNHIPYKGTGPALTDTIGGQTNIFASSAESVGNSSRFST
jgi:tripartite-type tricarboxylate transporter receptor subunit TctC